MSDIAIRVENLSKRYRIGQREPYKALRDVLPQLVAAPFRRLRRNPESDYIWALKDVSFEVKRGEVVGIIGRNGAGKTTLLKILSRITEPTEGYVRLQGKVSSLLEVGAGFHTELTGRENIFLSGAILGMTRQEIRRKFDEIVAFAEIEKFIDMPVKHYSSGMYVRLAFSVAAHLEPEIFLVDEVLAVGDAIFQTKCLAKMKSLIKGGRTVLFVSHNMGAVSSVCDRGIVLDEGRILFDGPVQKAIDFYQNEVVRGKYIAKSLDERKDRMGTGEVRLTSFHIEDERGNRIERIPNGHTVRLVFGYRSRDSQGAKNVDLGINVKTEKGERIFQFGTRFTGQRFKKIPPKGYIICTIKRFPLVPGRYSLEAYLEVNTDPSDYVIPLTYIDVIDGDFYGSGYQVYENESKILIDGTWSYTPDS